MQASNFVQTIEDRQGVGVACIEKIAYDNDWIDEEQKNKLAKSLIKSGYGKLIK